MKFSARNTDEIRLFLGGNLVHKTKDAIGTILVIDYLKHRVMTFDSMCEQSSMPRSDPTKLAHAYMQGMMLSLAFLRPQHVTILGLGGGCLVRSIHRVYPTTHIEAVELRKEVVQVCNDFFGIPKVDHIRVTIADGNDHLSGQDASTTDIIFSDMYDEYSMDPIQEQESFLLNCQRTLSNKGCLALNFHRLPDRDSHFFQCLHAFFSDVLICTPDPGNFIVFASKARLQENLADYSANYREIDVKINGQAKHLFRNIIRKTA